MKKRDKGAVIYHRVFAHEDFDHTAHVLLRLLRNAQRTRPGAPRYLYLDIDGHRNADGGFDEDMFELQSKFMAEFLLQFLTRAELPLGSIRNRKPQNDDIPAELNILKVDPPPDGPERGKEPRP